jgi:hypothetical protein
MSVACIPACIRRFTMLYDVLEHGDNETIKLYLKKMGFNDEFIEGYINPKFELTYIDWSVE